MELAYILTRNLYPYLLPSIMSFLDHNEIEKIYIMAEDEKLPYTLPEQCEVIKIDPLDYFRKDGPNYQSRWTPFCLSKVAIARILKDVDKILYVDVDTICTDNLDELYNTPLKKVDLNDGTETELYVAAAPEIHKQDYFNAGVMLLNLKAIRQDRADQWMINYINTMKLPCPDQDAYNEVSRQRKVNIHFRYNETNWTGKSDTPAIVHYAGYNPWWKKYIPRFEYYEKYKHYETWGD